ncbi:MAG: hypothetical protein SFU98_17020, partial [Leptospiraceae bacterium]|nr:hypothetical protein [Leptospiraceae bacterium]
MVDRIMFCTRRKNLCLSMLLVLSIFGCQVQFERSPNRFFSLLFGAVSSSSQSPQTPTATIGGTITGLTSNGLILRLNNQTLQTIASGASNYKFTEVPVGTFTLDFQSTPPGLFCLFVEQTNSFSISGNTTDSNVSSLNINCSPTQVASVYPTNGANWNQYIQYPIFPTLINGVETPYATADTACTPTNTYRSCIHGAVLKQIPLPGLKSCTGITAYDYDSSSNLVNGLQWSCMVDATGNYWIRSSGLREEKGLRDFIDFSSSTWKQMKVRVFYNDSQVFETSPIVWWSNTIVNQNTTCLIAIPTGNQIYIIGNALSCNTTSLSNNRIAVVSSPGTQVQFVNASSSFLQGNFNWIEINYISNGTPTSAINLSNTRFWHIRNSNFVNLGSNVAITSSTGANNNRIHGSFITGNIGFTNAVSFSSLTD